MNILTGVRFYLTDSSSTKSLTRLYDIWDSKLDYKMKRRKLDTQSCTREEVKNLKASMYFVKLHPITKRGKGN